jgi:hypothetical protein
MVRLMYSIVCDWLFVCSANDICHNQGKSRITADHVLKAIDELEFPFGDKLKECYEGNLLS